MLVWIIVSAFAFVGLLIIPFGLAGQFCFPLALALAQWLDPATEPDWRVIGIALGLASLLELLEYLLGLALGRAAGGSRAAGFGALGGGVLGAILGTLVLPVVGSVLGALVGTFAGAASVEYTRERQGSESIRIGLWSMIGRLIGLVLKGTLATAFLIYSISRCVAAIAA